MDLVTKTRKRKNHNVNFVKRIAPLIEYFKQNGTLSKIKQSDEYEFNGEMVKIGWLVTNLRQEKRKGLLQDSDKMLLDYLGIDWGDILNQHLEVLEDYYLKNKTLSNLTQYSGDYSYKDKLVSLGNIISYLRQSEDLTKEQIEDLAQKGLILAPKSVENVLAPFVAYYEKFGTIADVGANEVFELDGKTYNLGRKINYFRTKYNKGLLKQEYIEKLNAMGMCWSKRKQEANSIEL